MAIKSKRIHLIERDNRMIRLDANSQVWESGYWIISDAKAKQLLGGSILFHKKQKEPAFFGGVILNYRIQKEGEWKGRVIFTFEYRGDHRMVVADRGGWSQEMKVVVKE